MIRMDLSGLREGLKWSRKIRLYSWGVRFTSRMMTRNLLGNESMEQISDDKEEYDILIEEESIESITREC